MEEIARVALAACADSGFVLAGGNALIAHNIGDRPTHDVDLFTNVADHESFDSALDRVTHALEEQGAAVRRVDSGGTLARMYVTPAGQTDEILVELSQDCPRFPAVDLDVGPVLDPRDALANKPCALYDRRAARDYIDVHRALESGVVGSWADAIELADQQSATPPPRDYVRQGSERAKDLDAGELARYGFSDSDVADLRHNFDKGVATVEEQMGQRRATFIARMAKDSARPAVAPPSLDIQHRGPRL